MSEKTSGKDNNKDPLPNHKKIKNRMIPNFLTQVPMEFTRYVDDVLPEIIGIALLHDSLGFRRGAELSLEIARFMNGLEKLSFPLISAIGDLSDSEKTDFIKHMEDKGFIREIETAFTPLNSLLDITPVNFIHRNISISREQSLGYLKNCVDRHLSRYSDASSSAMATLYYTQAVVGKIYVAKHLHVPDLDAIISDPESEEAQRSKADVRIFSLMAIGQLKNHVPSAWPKTFWHKSRATSPCEYWNPDEQPEQNS